MVVYLLLLSTSIAMAQDGGLWSGPWDCLSCIWHCGPQGVCL